MKTSRLLALAVWCWSLGASLKATELLRNGGFEQPVTEALSQTYSVNQQGIPDWQICRGSVTVLNHTRLLAGTGYQSLLLPCDGASGPALQQAFEVTNAAPVRVSFMLAASKAIDGRVEVMLDERVVRTIHMADYWQPEEIALTDQMKWRAFTLSDILVGAGRHTLGLRVAQFQSRSDRQGDTRENVQGVLVDAVSVQLAPFVAENAGSRSRTWPSERPVPYRPTGVLTLDAVAGPWQTTRTLACYPSLANFAGALRSTKELGGLQYVHFSDLNGPEGVIDAVTLDGAPVFCDESRWYPYQLCTRSLVESLAVTSTTRMVFADHGILNAIALTNRTDRPMAHDLEINLLSRGGVERTESSLVMVTGSVARAYRFSIPPEELTSTNGSTFARWRVALPPHGGAELDFALAFDQSSDSAREKVERWGADFTQTFGAAKLDWENRWHAVFTPGNKVYSGCLPTFDSKDRALRELYYLSVASLLETERDNFPEFKQCFVGEDPEWGGDVSWFWDYSLTSLPYALLNPAVMKDELRHWLTIDWRTCSHYSLRTGNADGNWYAVNPYAYFLSFDRYLTVTRDFGFLAEQYKGKTVLAYLEMLAMDWQRLVPPKGKLADIGGNCWNMLEAPPNYVHVVASINAANVWMMRRLAEYHAQLGHGKRAAELRAQANALVPEILKLYNPVTGSWNVLYPDGKQIDSRHVYDYLTVGTTMAGDLRSDVKAGMIGFVNRELMTGTWMRAMSRQDPSAFDSDRSDHGPAGSYSAWPAKSAQATAELGDFPQALDMFHRFRRAFTSAIPQAVELTAVSSQKELQARVSTRAGASFAEVSGVFSEVIINTFFGFRPAPDGTVALWEPQVPRGFKGQLRGLSWNGARYTITSDRRGLRLEKEQ